jgi:hypothetical protein
LLSIRRAGPAGPVFTRVPSQTSDGGTSVAEAGAWEADVPPWDHGLVETSTPVTPSSSSSVMGKRAILLDLECDRCP